MTDEPETPNPSDVGRTETVSRLTDLTWTAIAPLEPWRNFGQGTIPAGFRRLGDHVELRGAVYGGGRGAPVFELPENCRPPGSTRLPIGMPPNANIRGPGVAVAAITAAGLVTIETDSWTVAQWFDLAAVTFSVDVELAEQFRRDVTTGREGLRGADSTVSDQHRP